MDRKFFSCNIKIDSNNYTKDRTVCKDCYHTKKRKYRIKTFIQNQHRKIENVNTNNNNRTLLVGPNFSGKTYLMLYILSRKPDQDLYITIKSPVAQYTNSKIKIRDIGEERKTLNEYENATIVFKDILGSKNSRSIHQFFIRGRHMNFDNFYLSHFYFDLTKTTIRNISYKLIPFNQTIKDNENRYRDVAA